MSFDEQPGGNIHGECAAEIHRLEGEVTIWRNSAEAQTERLKEAEEAIADGKKPDLVPGVVHCARCNFRLTRVTLYMGNGAIGPGGSETEQCPNGCGPMWPVTWKQEAEDAYKIAESQAARAKAAEDQLDACSPYLKEGETAAECISRHRADIIRLMGLLGAEKKAHERARTALDKIAQTTGSDDPCRPLVQIARDALKPRSHALDCLHINQGSVGAAADAYEAEYAAEHPGWSPPEDRTDMKTLPLEGSALRKLGARLAELLDEDQFAECEKMIMEANKDASKAWRRSIMFGDVIHNHVIAMQAAVIASRLESPVCGMKWIDNTLFGPGMFPNIDEAEKVGGAQAWFDCEVKKHIEFRRLCEQEPAPAAPTTKETT